MSRTDPIPTCGETSGFNDSFQGINNTTPASYREMAMMSSTDPILTNGESSSYYDDSFQENSWDEAGHIWNQYGNPKWDI